MRATGTEEYCDSIGIQYLSAPFDIPSVRFLGTLGMPLIKIPSGEITNLPYLEEIGKLHTPALLSTGMCNLSEITDALASWTTTVPGSNHSALQHPVPDSL